MGRSARRRGREGALQVLFQLDSGGEPWDAGAALEAYFANFEHPEASRAFVEELVRGVVQHRDEVDAAIAATSTKWRLERMSAVDRNILRIGTYELMHRCDVPAAVVINEAVEVAKRFGSENSGGFVNGVLDEVARNLGARGRR